MPITIDVAIAKTHKFASRESGDSAEVVERPGGGISVVVVDGQGSGAAAKRLSLLIAGRVISLLSDGVRDEAVARAAHDVLYSYRDGRVSAALDIASVDVAAESLTFCRNSQVPMLICWGAEFELVSDSGLRIGVRRDTSPILLEYPAEPGLAALLVTDGVLSAGKRFGTTFDLLDVSRRLDLATCSAEAMADRLLRAAIEADRGRPQDDQTVVALRIGPGVSHQPIRRMAVSIPLTE
jgi:serine phosphatase RsbU (regulator of sigma subunit)